MCRITVGVSNIYFITNFENFQAWDKPIQSFTNIILFRIAEVKHARHILCSEDVEIYKYSI
jgi:hypothetical protein